MKNIKNIIFSLIAISFVSCESLVDGINENPNQISSENFEAGVLLLKGIQLANTTVQVGHQTRISSMWSGQSVGSNLLYRSIYEYNISSEESNAIWENAYFGVIKNARLLSEQTATDPKARQYAGITKVIEAQALGTLASLFGDIPFSEISSDVANPKFESQKSVLEGVQKLLDEAIADLEAGPASV
ncbi:MAG TPA: SusD/RagB family nutrient-binding outer membrane lipoprotein, partial [Saprospiraceae bacterium]|nr:SusD/RagB family nutrient-binding outer membrane lipoprotein [Saprospiraceae bacterium]